MEQKKDLSKLKTMFSDYQKKQKKTNGIKGSILAKYFVPRNEREVFRILPPKEDKKHIEEAFFHVVPTTIAGGKTKYNTILYCPRHNDPFVKKLDANGEPLLDSNNQPIMIPAPCPICAKNKVMLSKQDRSIKGIKKDNMTEDQKKILEKNNEIFKDANKWAAKKFYIVRGIDKGSEKDGVKFWRFKHNFRNQGTLDKLLPVLRIYMEQYEEDFSDALKGCDLSITMTDGEFNGRTFKQITAITVSRPKSKLHEDELVSRAWLNDNISWRDVFKPRQAPGMSPYEYLVSVVNETNPYWEDSDASNKHWVFPGNPELEEAANTRKRNLDANNDNENIEMASDVSQISGIKISNMTEKHVGKDTDNATDLGKEALIETSTNVDTESTESTEPEGYDDLPF